MPSDPTPEIISRAPLPTACGFFSFVAGPGSWARSWAWFFGIGSAGLIENGFGRPFVGGDVFLARELDTPLFSGRSLASRAKDSASGWCLSSPRGFTSQQRGAGRP